MRPPRPMEFLGRTSILLLVSLSAAWMSVPARAQGFGGTVRYTGDLGPVSAQRPLCLCIYRNPDLTGGLGCLIFRRDDTTYDVELGRSDYYLVAFLDIHINERLDGDEPYEIFRDRAAPPGDGVAGASGRTDVDFIFGDENLSPVPTASPTPMPSATPSPTATAPSMPSPSPTLTETPVCAAARASDCTGACAGDCDGSGDVALNEIIAVVRDALAPSASPCGDADRDGTVEIDEILAAIGRNLSGCLSLRAAAVFNPAAGPRR